MTIIETLTALMLVVNAGNFLHEVRLITFFSGLAIDHPPEAVTIQAYADGFVINGGAFRPLSDPANQATLERIRRG